MVARSASRRTSPHHPRRLQVESLEERQLLATDIDIAGSLVERDLLGNSTIGTPAEVDSYNVALDAGQVVTLLADASGGLASSISLRDPASSVIGSAEAGVNNTALLQSVAAPAAGIYTVEITGAGGSTGSYELVIVLNAAAEAESVDGTSNDTLATAEDLGSSLINLPAGGDHAAVIGSLETGDTADHYAMAMTSGQQASFSVRADADGIELDVLDSSGQLLATGVSAANVDQTIQALTDLSDDASIHTYVVRVAPGTAPAGTEYTLLITRDTGFESEPNFEFDNSQAVGESILGGVAAPTFSGTRLNTQFAAMDSNSTACNCQPPDTHGVAGPDHVLEVVNTAIAIYHKDGSIALPPTELKDFFAPSIVAGESFDFDPVVAYDEQVERWVVVVLIGASASAAETDVLYAISDTSDPTQGFTEQHRIDMAGISPGLFADYPKIGWNADSHVVTVNMFSAFFYEDVNIVSIDKSTVLDADPATFGVQITERNGIDHFTMAAATMHDAQPGDPMWFVEETEYNGGNSVRVVRMDDTNSATPTYTDYVIPITSYSSPPEAPQAGGSLFTTNDGRILNAEYRGGRLVATHAAGVSGKTVARWYEFDVSGTTPVLVQEGNVDPGPGIYTYFPSIAINAKGDIGLTYMQSSSSEFVSMYVTGQAFGSDPDTLAAPVLVKAGNENYAGSRGGDYSGISVDPVTDSFWAFNEISLSGPAPNPLWSTWAGEFEVAPNEDQDWYSLSVEAGNSLMLETSTPLDGANRVINDLDPRLELFDPAGNLLITDDNQAGDDKNALISYTATETGEYRVLVAPSQESTGTYQLSIQGATGVRSGPVVVNSTPTDELKLAAFPTTVRLDFSQPILLSSIDAEDVTIGELPATSATLIDGDTFEFGVNPSANIGDGTYTVLLADDVMTDYRGAFNAAFSSTFDLDSSGPKLLATQWNGATLPADKTLNPGPLTFSASFNEGLFAYESARRGLRTPGTEDIVLTETVTGQTYEPLTIAYDTSLEIFTAEYAPLPEGNFELRLISGDGAFEDEVGNDLDGEPLGTDVDRTPTGDQMPGGDYVIEFTVDINGIFTGLTPFQRWAPEGDLVSASRDNAGVLSSPADEDAFSFYSEVGETVAVQATPGTPGATLSLRYSGNTYTATAPGEAVYLPAEVVTVGGNQTVTVLGDAASDYRVAFYRNASIEALEEGGPVALTSSQVITSGGLYSAVGSSQGSVGLPTFTQYNDSRAFVDISSTGISLGLGDDGEATITTSVSNELFPGGSLTVSNNGALVEGADVNVNYDNGTLPTSAFGAALLPFWDDIDSSAGNVYWEERSVDGIDTLIVQWDDRPHFTGVGNATFQVQVFDSGNVAARFAYQDVDFGSPLYDGGASATIGWQSGTGDAETFSENAASLVASDVLELTITPANTDIDEFTVLVDAGHAIDVVLAGRHQSFDAETLQLLDPNGLLVATGGTVEADFDLGVLAYPVTTSGEYTIRLSSMITDDYSITVSEDLRLETEPNDVLGAALRSVEAGVGAVGSLEGGEVSFRQFGDISLFVDISETGSLLNLGDDTEATINTTVGNSVFPAGPVTVGNNGGIIVGAGGDLGATNGSLPSSGFGTALLPFWDDIDSETGGVYWEQRVVGGIETLIVQWDDRPHYLNSGSTTFQVQVPQSGSVVARFAYRDVIFGNPSWNNGASATIGYQESANNAFQFSFNSPVISNGDVIEMISTDEDKYQIELLAGETVTFETSTPLDNPAHMPLNTADPRLDVLASDGAVLESDSGSAADGKNALLEFMAPADGIYIVNVVGEAGTGEYVLDVRGAGSLAGDFDANGELDCDDIDALTREAAAGTNNLLFDVTDDNLVDLADVHEWILNLKGTLIGDANLDFGVDVTDFNVWNSNKFTAGTAWCSGDFNADGETDVSDFNIWNANKFRNTETSVAAGDSPSVDEATPSFHAPESVMPAAVWRVSADRNETSQRDTVVAGRDVVLARWRADSLPEDARGRDAVVVEHDLRRESLDALMENDNWLI